MGTDRRDGSKRTKSEPGFPTTHRMQLLEYDGYKRLSEVMETVVPLHGKCNFPTIDVTPKNLVQMVRSRLMEQNIKVKDIRLNGSAATHVLSNDKAHNYKDLDLIFAVDLSPYSDDEDLANNLLEKLPKRSVSRTRSGCHDNKQGFVKIPASRQRSVSEDGAILPTTQSTAPPTWSAKCLETLDNAPSSRPSQLQISEWMENNHTENGKISPLSDIGSSNNKAELDEDVDDVTDSGYTSSGSSVSSYPLSPASHWSYRSGLRARTHSLESSSSVTSSSSVCASPSVRKNPRSACKRDSGASESASRRLRFSATKSKKDQCWRKIKDVVISILMELLPSEMRGNTDAVSDAYIQKMVKVTNEGDSWSLLSLNNNTGKNLELKFVESMQRQYEFSVDSFQIILDSYLGFEMVIRDSKVGLSDDFYPSILAESVYGDFKSALRHLHHKRICTYRPEEIRGGGLLRYCNLLVRDFKPGEVPGFKKLASDTVETMEFDPFNEDANPNFDSADVKDVERLEQLMCSRFFIDFNDFNRQQKKLSSYLESHFVNEEDLKFNYLLTLCRVVDQNTICLMTHERSLIISYITNLARQTLASNIGNSVGNKKMVANAYQQQNYFYSTQNSSQVSQMCTQQATTTQQPYVDYSSNLQETHCLNPNYNTPYQNSATVYSYVEPISTSAEQMPAPDQISNAQPTVYYMDPHQQVYSCCGTCNHCGAKQVFQQGVDNTYVDSYNTNNSNNNTADEYIPSTCYMYPTQGPVYYQQDSQPTYIYPPPQMDPHQNPGIAVNDAPIAPVVFCSPGTQCYYGAPSVEHNNVNETTCQ